MMGRSDQDGTANVAGAFGPYLQAIPVNPFTNDNEINATYLAGDDWTYAVDAQGDPSFNASDDATHALW